MKGVFVGLATLDMIYYVKRVPTPDQKIQALDHWLGAGGPATNAAITFAALGGQAQLVTALGDSPAARIVRDDLRANHVCVIDIAGNGDLAVSSIAVDEWGRRSVVSANAAGFGPLKNPTIDFADAAIVLVDGHHVDASIRLLDQARQAGVPIILDGGSRKPGTDDLLERVQYVVASSAFGDGLPPTSVAESLLRDPVGFAAVSTGADPIVGFTRTRDFAIRIPHIKVVDTLGAGDVLHGAFAYHLASGEDPVYALEQASVVASESCSRHGPRIAP